MALPIVHPRFLAAVPAGFFPSRCTVQEQTGTTQDDHGQEVEVWTDVAGLTDIPCAKAPLSAIERQAAQLTVTDRAWSVLLKGAYPAITTAHRAIIDGTAFDIERAETDQTGTLTRLVVRSVET
jgi:head-tail adaptor